MQAITPTGELPTPRNRAFRRRPTFAPLGMPASARACLWIALLAGSLALAACSDGAKASAPGAAPARATLLLGPEDVLVVGSAGGPAGPLLTGTLQPERRADLRAELGAVVTAVLRENGEPVRQGELLVRLDDTAVRDALLSAQAAERAAGQALEQAQRQLDRLQTLRASGMASMQALEDTEARRDAARSELAGAQARVAQARQQLQRTEVRAPFDGVVSERKVSVGDTAQVGRELLKVIDPRRLRIEGVLPAEAAASLRVGQTVSYRVQGQDATAFTGTLRRISPAAQAATRQVEVQVEVDPTTPARLAGLYVEGRVHASEAAGLALPASAVVAEGRQAWAWKIEGQRLRKVPVDVAPRDPRRGDHALRGGLAAGDRVLRHPVGNLSDGQAVRESGPVADAAGRAS